MDGVSLRSCPPEQLSTPKSAACAMRICTVLCLLSDIIVQFGTSTTPQRADPHKCMQWTYCKSKMCEIRKLACTCMNYKVSRSFKTEDLDSKHWLLHWFMCSRCRLFNSAANNSGLITWHDLARWNAMQQNAPSFIYQPLNHGYSCMPYFIGTAFTCFQDSTVQRQSTLPV